MPSYNCGVELDPLFFLGIEPIFYRIQRDLSADLEQLESLPANSAKALMVTHFLGFPQPIDNIVEICRKKKWILLEDCAHSFLSEYLGKPLGSFGDAGFFSLVKTLPVPNGGVLALNRISSTNIGENKISPNKISTLLAASDLFTTATKTTEPFYRSLPSKFVFGAIPMLTWYVKRGVALSRKILKPNALWLVRADSYQFLPELLSWGLSASSMNILYNTDLNRVRSVRRKNFQYLLKHFLKQNPEICLFRSLPDGACPLFFPLLVKGPEARQALYLRMKRAGVVSYPWWDKFHPGVPWHAFPEAVSLKHRIFGLPVHQDLEETHLNIVIETLRRALRDTSL